MPLATNAVITTPLNFEEIHEHLYEQVDMVMSIRRSVQTPASELAGMARAEQERFLESLRLINRTSTELAYNFCMFALPGLRRLQPEDWHTWVLHVMDTYDDGGVLRAILTMQKVEEYVDENRARGGRVELEEISRRLGAFVTGLNGRALKLTPLTTDEPYTDTEALYLPARLSALPTEEQNAALYKALAVHQWAQTWYGTWRSALSLAFAEFADPTRACRIFHRLETTRLDACIARDLPGLQREIATVVGESEIAGDDWRQALNALSEIGTGADDSLLWTRRLYHSSPVPRPLLHQGTLRPQETEAVIARRMIRDREDLAEALADLGQAQAMTGSESGQRQDAVPGPIWTRHEAPDEQAPHGIRVELHLHGEPLPLPEEVRQLVDSIVQDTGNMPQEYLQPAGHGRYPRGTAPAPQTGDASIPDNVLNYDEWDYTRQHYRKHWCVLCERAVHPGDENFVDTTLRKHRASLRQLYRAFEALRGENRRLRRQPFGDDIDIDAVVQAHAEQTVGLEIGERLFSEMRRVERNVAVMFLVDMSGSTKGWINDMVREALVLLCEALETLGDRYGIYGFSGFTHKRCELYRIKPIDEPYDQHVRARISGIRPQDYTRLGVFIRHLTRTLLKVDARTRLLITLSDGRPDDQDGYRGQYGIEDTRKALFEARCQGIHPYCITIDDEAMDYLPHMYGPVGFTVVDNVDKLPLKLSDIYRRVTYA